MPEKEIVNSEITVQAAQAELWEYLADETTLTALCSGGLGIRILFENADTNPYRPEAMKYVFTARVSPFSLLFTGTGCSYALRISDLGKACRIMIAAAYDDTSFITPTKQQLDNFLQRIDNGFVPGAPTHTNPGFSAGQQDITDKSDPQQATSNKKTFRLSPEENAAGPGFDIEISVSDSSGLDSLGDDQNDDSSPTPVFTKSRGRQTKRKRWPIVVVVLAVLLCGAYLAYMFLPSVQALFNTTPAASGFSNKVTYKTALEISLGASRESVERSFGTDGVPAPGKYENRQIYRGGNISGNGLYNIQVCIDYSGAVVTRITYLDLGVASNIESLYDRNAAITADMTMEAIAGSVGVPASMIRIYRDGGSDIVEMHFGFTDPFANFDPAWRGEVVVTVDKTAQTLDKRFWSGYDGSDPLMINSLEGQPVSNQYSDYTEFLNDKYQYDYSLYMLNRYSDGDMRRVFGDILLYDDTSGAHLYYSNSHETLPSGQPRYVMTFGFDSQGHFLMSSFSNMFLFKKQGMLADSSCNDIMRGMAYNEVRYLLKVLPSAIWIDQNYFTLCYGQKLDSSVFENSFEFILRIDIENNYVQTIWNNTVNAPPESE